MGVSREGVPGSPAPGQMARGGGSSVEGARTCFPVVVAVTQPHSSALISSLTTGDGSSGSRERKREREDAARDRRVS